MAKTGKLAAFTLGEKKTAMVNLPAQFVTAKDANSKGQRYSRLVDYSLSPDKVNDFNNQPIDQNLALKKQFYEEGYATRPSATTEQEPVFSSDKLHYNNYDISLLRRRLDRAQENGNNIHELAFSLRGDWLVKNKLYDPETGIIDQDKLKHAQQEVAKTLINKGFSLPLGENEKDVVWFGVIHQDTDHLNMHLWFAKESKETRPEMLKQTGPYKGEPTGVIPLQTIELAKRQFRNQLMTNYEHQKRTDVLKSLGQLKKDMVASSLDVLTDDRYSQQLEKIYQALPKEQKGRWQVGHSSLTATNTKMAKANQLTNQLLNDVFANELKTEYQTFQQLGYKFDDFNIEDQGVMRKGQQKLSDNKDEALRRRLANQLYRYLGEIEPTSTEDINGWLQQHSQIKPHYKAHRGILNNKTGIYTDGAKKSLNHNLEGFNVNNQNKLSLSRPSFNRISRVWQNEARADTNAQIKFLRAQKQQEQAQRAAEYEEQQYQGRGR
ncbi:MobP2 family relaxase [Leuconostoc pseudomesenteroides]|uniref:MobP2 family relaxase n=1 Tax=Leuconostoc pseudomesenteroides TaxID=33968 RepID=UPI0032DFAFBF